MKSLAPEKDRDLAKTRAHDPNASRAREIVASLRVGESTDIFDAFWQLDELPVEEVRDALVAWKGPLPDLDRLDPATRLAHGLPLRPLRLRTLSVAKDADILDIGPVAEEQLRLAGKSWDEADLAPEDRLDGELEGSFAGTLERRVLADADAPGDAPLFDVLLFAEDSGVVFAAGTTNVVALIAYKKVEMRDRRTRIAIEDVVTGRDAPAFVQPTRALDVVVAEAEAPTDTSSKAEPVEERPAAREEKVAAIAPEIVVTEAVVTKAVKKIVKKKAVAATKAVEKNTVATKGAKKTVATKAAKKSVATKAAKKSVATKAAKKTAVATKAAKKTVAPKKAVAKKVAARAPLAKKPAAKKATAKKVATKKSATKTPAKNKRR